MSADQLPLRELSIADLYFSPERVVYEVPIYQRNYAWGMDEISALVQDVYDAFCANKDAYFIGTLVTFQKGKHVYEVIDGQQRLTTIYLILKAMGLAPTNELTYRSRQKSTNTIARLGKPDFDGAAKVDEGIADGFLVAQRALEDIVGEAERHVFSRYFRERVRIVFYRVPKDVDLNHYFEVMNSRGEQLEQHEVVKAMLLGKLADAGDRAKFNMLWEHCSEMDGYIQQKLPASYAERVFGACRNEFVPNMFDELPCVEPDGSGVKSIFDLMSIGQDGEVADAKSKAGTRFQPIIDFPNFLLIVLKLTRMREEGFDPAEFTLDDKEIIRQFSDALSERDQSEGAQADFVKDFGYNLLLSKYYLDNYVVHHTLEEDKPGDNPWKLQCWEWHANESGDKGYPVNLFSDVQNQRRCEQLLSMFEVSFTARQRKNYLMYCMLYLHAHKDDPRAGYPEFLSDLARVYLVGVYLGPEGGLNEKNAPKPGSFDAVMLEGSVPGQVGYTMCDLHAAGQMDSMVARMNARKRFGDGAVASRGIPLFVFNYLDFLLWEQYFDYARGSKKDDAARKAFFERLGCSDFGLDVFDDFYFSRTRRSLEHFYPQALQQREEDSGQIGPTKAQINCLGNFAMIGRDMNSSGSDWSPKVKLDHYLDTASGKISRVSVASLKFMVMMQVCKDNIDARESGKEWMFEDIERHQTAMIDVLVGDVSDLKV